MRRLFAHRQPDEELRKSEARYRTVLDTAFDAIVTITPEGIVRWFNRGAERIFGYRAEEIIGQPVTLLMPARYRDLCVAGLHRYLQTGEARVVGGTTELVGLRKDGGEFPIEMSLGETHENRERLFTGVIRDVTERKRTEDALREMRDRFRSIFDHAPIGVAMVSLEGRYLQVNRSLCEILGYTEEEMQALTWQEITHPDDLAASSDYARRIVEGEFPKYHLEKRFLHAEGHTVWASLSVSLVRDGEGEPLYFVSQIQDVTERKRAESALRESEQRFRGSFERAATGMALVGTDGRFLRVNRSLCEILGYPERELLGKTFQELTHPDDLEVDLEHLRRLVAGDIRTYQTEKRYLHQDGHVVWALLSVSVVHDEEDEPLYFVSQIQDVSERKVLEKRLMRQAFHDTLTGLPNRHLLVNRLAHALERTRRRGNRQAMVLFMDLDGFKVVNDSLGHEAGDHLLVLLAERLRGCLRPEDTLARFGGDEFVVLLEDMEDPGEAVRVAERITNELKRPFVMDGRSLVASVSIGIAQGNARTKSPLDLLRDADTAMYRAKNEHADHRVFDPAMYERALKRLELESDLRRGVEDQEFVVHYQPIVDLETGETWGMEARLRWDHPERGLLEPSEFMAVMEESGLAVPMGERVLEEACCQAQRWQEQRPLTPPLVVSVNLSAMQLERSDLARIGAEVLGKTGLDPRRLSLDVTETACIRILEERIATLDRLKELGVGVAIDDFGVGYSSISYLKRVPADILKIDRSFVRGVGEVEEDTAIVRMIIDLAHTLGMKVVAEGIEEWAQAALLAEMGCDMGQGFYFSRPLLPEAVPEFLAG
jgi:diguanylate cyclase (GGDEF)-like protein/PAS domain S-box-containing protein